MKSVPIHPKILRAAALLAPKDDIRYYLNGVLVEVAPDAVYYVATNGHALIAFCEKRPDNEAPYESAQVIVPRDVARALKPFKDMLGTLEHDGLAPATLKTAKGEQVFKPFDGKFPDWRRVVPVACSGEHAQYNPELLAIFSDIGRELGRDKDAIPVVVVEPNGASGGLVAWSSADNYVGVVMPWKAWKHDGKSPDWAHWSPAAEERKAA